MGRASAPDENHGGLALVHRSPTAKEFERFRLALSTFQDGSGQERTTGGRSLPGWRDFERTVADVFRGTAYQTKGVFDVLIRDLVDARLYYGISCKMSGMRSLDSLAGGTGRVRMELSNSSAAFWRYLGPRGIVQDNYKERPDETAAALIELIRTWHVLPLRISGARLDLERSSYLVLSWDKSLRYQLHQFRLELPEASNLDWTTTDGAIRGSDDFGGILLEWYGTSGGQLKYYPRTADAIWESPLFSLESNDRQAPPSRKAADYFPEAWLASQEEQ